MTQRQVKRFSRNVAKPVLNWLWNLVDALTPPWIRSLGIFTSLIWFLCVSFGAGLLNAADPSTSGMALIFTDETWGLVSLAVAVVCSWSVMDFSNVDKRKVALGVVTLYWASAAFLIEVGRWNRPMGYFHAMFACFSAIAFFRPLILYYIKEWKEKIHMSE